MSLARALGVTTSVFIIVEDAFIPPNDVVIKAWPIPDFGYTVLALSHPDPQN